jgi:hypothetical protein
MKPTPSNHSRSSSLLWHSHSWLCSWVSLPAIAPETSLCSRSLIVKATGVGALAPTFSLGSYWASAPEEVHSPTASHGAHP